MSEAVRVTRGDGILEVVLDRPKANAIDSATSRALGQAFAGFRDDPELRVAIVTGGGEKFFSAGWDLKAAAEGSERPGQRLRRRRLRRAAGAARPQQAGDRGAQRHGGRRRLRAGAVLRPDPGGRACPLRPARDRGRHAGRRRHHQAAAPHPPPCRHGPAAHRPLDGRGRGQGLGPGQRDPAAPTASCRAPASSPACSPTGRRWSSPRSRRPCAGPRACRSSRPWTWSPRSACRRSSGSTRATTSSRVRGRSRRSASRSGGGGSRANPQ